MKNQEINIIIASALKTKNPEKFKHTNILKALGLRFGDNSHSEQNYLFVEHIETGKSVVISKDYGHKTRVYGNFYHAFTEDEQSFNDSLKKVDFYNYLTSTRKSNANIQYVQKLVPSKYGYRYWKTTKVDMPYMPKTKVAKYKDIKDNANSQRSYAEMDATSYQNKLNQIARLQSELRDLSISEEKHLTKAKKYEAECKQLLGK